MKHGTWVYSSSQCNGAPWQFHTEGATCSFVGEYLDEKLVIACCPQTFDAPIELRERVMRALFEWVFYNDLLVEGFSFSVPLTDADVSILSELTNGARERIE